MKFLKKHPFGVEAFFEKSTVLTFALPKESLEAFLPDYLTLDTFQDQWAFVAIAMVQTQGLRPAGFPKTLGSDFFLMGYRIFVRYKNKAGKNLRGLYILKSETDKKRMEMLGNVFTNYNYSTTDIQQTKNADYTKISSTKSNFKVLIEVLEKEVEIPASSPFSNWKEARRFAGPLPHTFTVDPVKKEVLIIKGIRQNWHPKPVKIIEYQFEFLKDLGLENAILASAFEITNIPYRWEKGKIEKWS